MVVSFHPCIEADVNIVCAGKDPGGQELAAIRRAEAVILPQGCRRSLYRMARENCRRVFPDYDARFQYPGKTGQIQLFRKTGTAHPDSVLFADVQSCLAAFAAKPPMGFPLVFKFDWGGEGRGVFRFDDTGAMKQVLNGFASDPPAPCLVQAFVPGGHRTLRVVVVGRAFLSYWRSAADPEGFYANLSCGGTVDPASDPALQSLGVGAVRDFCNKTGINLAGFDLIFSGESTRSDPLFLEINFFFGRRGLGGSEAFYRLLEDAVRRWLVETGDR
jgi:ribosomal protein S6--L-glutamate ligase